MCTVYYPYEDGDNGGKLEYEKIMSARARVLAGNSPKAYSLLESRWNESFSGWNAGPVSSVDAQVDFVPSNKCLDPHNFRLCSMSRTPAFGSVDAVHGTRRLLNNLSPKSSPIIAHLFIDNRESWRLWAV